jgi:hypothetical protein
MTNTGWHGQSWPSVGPLIVLGIELIILPLAVVCKLMAVLSTIIGYVTYRPNDLDRQVKNAFDYSKRISLKSKMNEP